MQEFVVEKFEKHSRFYSFWVCKENGRRKYIPYLPMEYVWVAYDYRKTEIIMEIGFCFCDGCEYTPFMNGIQNYGFSPSDAEILLQKLVQNWRMIGNEVWYEIRGSRAFIHFKKPLRKPAYSYYTELWLTNLVNTWNLMCCEVV